eukprot:6503575-Lingulodinium_polyedra.AAC.1
MAAAVAPLGREGAVLARARRAGLHLSAGCALPGGPQRGARGGALSGGGGPSFSIAHARAGAAVRSRAGRPGEREGGAVLGQAAGG